MPNPLIDTGQISKHDDDGKAARLGFALTFRCPVCRWKKGCDRATGFDEVEGFHYEFMRKALKI